MSLLGRKKNALWLVACVAASVLFAACARAEAYQQEVKALAQRSAESMGRSGKKSIAVVDFTDLQGTVTELGRFLAEELSVALALEAKDFEVIDRTHLKTLLQEHRLSTTGLIDPQTARKLGQIAGVEALATGSITPFGDSVRLSLKVLDTATARMLGAATAEIPRTKAIEELLNKGIGAGPNGAGDGRPTSGPAVQTPGPTTAPPGHAAPEVTALAGPFKIAVRSCEKEGTRVDCSGYVLNRSQARNKISFSTWLGSLQGASIVDDRGYQSPKNRFRLGTLGPSQDLEPEISVGFSITEIEVSPDATSLTLVVGLAAADGPWEKVSLRRVPLKAR